MICQVTDLNVTFDEASSLEGKQTAIARIFGKVYGPMAGKVEHYHSDLARDVFWLDTNFSEVVIASQTFYWSFREAGSSIGFDDQYVRALGGRTFECKVDWENKWGEEHLVLRVNELPS